MELLVIMPISNLKFIGRLLEGLGLQFSVVDGDGQIKEVDRKGWLIDFSK